MRLQPVKRIKAHLESPEAVPQEKFEAIRERLLKAIVYVFAGLGFPALAAALLEALHYDLWGSAAVYTGLYIPVLAAAALFKRLPSAAVEWLLFAAIYGMGAFTLFNGGLSSAGGHLLLALCALASVLAGLRTGLWVMAASLIAIITAAAGFLSGVFSLQPLYAANSTALFSWMAASASFLLLGAALVLVPGILQRHLRTSLQAATRNEQKLMESNRQLHAEISERKKIEQQLRENEDRLNVLFQYAPDGYYLNDRNGVLIDGNRMAEELGGYTKAEFAGKSFAEMGLISPEDLPRANAILEKNRRGEPSGPDELTLIRKNSTPVSVEVRTYPTRLQGRMVTLGIARDMTERKAAEAERLRLEAQLHHAQRMEAIGTLAGGIAHDFNNILAIIIGHTDLAIAETPDSSPAQQNLEEIRRAGMRAKELVAQILLTARRQEQKLAVIRAEPIVKECLKMLRASIPSTVEIRQHIEEALPPILGDPSQLQQVVINLCNNAAQSMEHSGGTLTVELGGAGIESRDAPGSADLPEGPYLRLRVKDTGPGIAPELRERIFEPYFTTKGVGEGSGLGLAVARGIVQARGGEIFLESRQGRGATFTVYLPATAAQPDEAGEDAAPELQRGEERVLFVDDEPAIRMLGKRMLEHLGYTAEARADGRDALECFRADPYGFDLVITDMTMPQMKGDALARALLAIRPDLPVILCTGYSSQAAAEAAGDIGIREFVKKPLTVYTLGRAIRKALD